MLRATGNPTDFSPASSHSFLHPMPLILSHPFFLLLSCFLPFSSLLFLSSTFIACLLCFKHNVKCWGYRDEYHMPQPSGNLASWGRKIGTQISPVQWVMIEVNSGALGLGKKAESFPKDIMGNRPREEEGPGPRRTTDFDVTRYG